MWSLLFNFLGSGAFGGILGAVGSWITRREERLQAKDKFAHEQCMAQLANQQQVRMAEEGRKTIEEHGKADVAREEAKAFKESQKGAKDMWRWVRPAVIIYLLVVCTYIWVNVASLVGGLSALGLPQLLTLYASIIDSFFALLMLAVSWLFGARGSSAKPHLK